MGEIELEELFGPSRELESLLDLLARDVMHNSAMQ